MRLGVLSDVHGNQEALGAVLSAMASAGVDRIVCLGDIVGYNAGSNECVRALRAIGAESIAGNHELMVLGNLGFERCADKVAHAVGRTRRILAGDVRALLATLPVARLIEDGILLLHGGAYDPERYLRSPVHVSQEDLLVSSSWPGARLCLFGHTHAPGVYEVVDGVACARAVTGVVALDPERRTWLNPGSVDGARKREGRAAQFALVDTARWTVELCAVGYDHLAAEGKARAAGFRMSRLQGLLRRLGRRFRGPRRGARPGAARG